MKLIAEDNLLKLGVSEIDNPDTINIYPKDFDSKEEILYVACEKKGIYSIDVKTNQVSLINGLENTDFV